MSTQSWATWFLDAYASSVSHASTENTDRIESTSAPISAASPLSAASALTPSSPSSMGSASSQVSPYGPYVRTGRGGAGNFHWDSEQGQQSPDVESQRPISLAERRQAAQKLERIETGQAMQTLSKRAASNPYMHVGRGGAGNYTQSNEIQSAAKSPRSASSTYAPAAQVPTVGRGGAGNVMAAMDAKAKVQRERDARERQEADKRRENIEQQVADILPPPPGAVIAATSRRSSMLLQDV